MVTDKTEEEIKEDIKEDLEEEGVSEKIAEKEVELAEDISEVQVIDENLEEPQETGAHLEKVAEAESTDPKIEKSLEEKKKEILVKVKKLAGKIDVTKTEELKEQVKIKKRADMLIPLEEYVKSGIYLGTRVVTPKMKPFVYRRRADGLAIFNTDLIDDKLKEGVEFLSQFEPQDVILVCKRPAGWKAAQMFGKITGIRVFTRKYPAGILTNTTLPDFFEHELAIITDAWLDKNALNDTLNVNKKILMICDTNNFPRGTENIIIGNNKSPKSLGVIFYLLAKGYCKAKGIEAEIPDLEWWTEGDGEEKVRKKIRVVSRRPKYGV
jgi:small subunit ribosomal protein S2